MAPELRHVPRDAFNIIRRFPVASLLPAAALGAASDLLQLTHPGIVGQVLLGLALAVAFELYVGYAERLVLEADRGAETVGVAELVRAAWPLLPALLVGSIPAVMLPAAASGLLVLPGLWLVTRWALYAPVIAREGVGPFAALGRSSVLVRGRFWSVFALATGALIVEHAVLHGAAHGAEPALGSELLALLAAATAVAVVSPFAALTISLVYDRISGSPDD
jgi:hypothetical protein